MATKDREIESLKAKVRTQTQDQSPQVSKSSGERGSRTVSPTQSISGRASHKGKSLPLIHSVVRTQRYSLIIGYHHLPEHPGGMNGQMKSS